MSLRLKGLILVLIVLGLVPFALIARSRAQRSPQRGPQLFYDMIKQQKYRPQAANEMFADGRAMRPVVPGVAAQEDVTIKAEQLNSGEGLVVVNGQPQAVMLKDQAAYDRVMLGQVKTGGGQAEFVAAVPAEIPVTMELMQRGQERFNIYCTPCHGVSGYGDGMVAQRAAALQEAGQGAVSGWAPPTSYHSADARKWPPGHIYNVITNGVRSMPRYDKQISVYDRWAIVAYVKALQRSQYSTDLNDLPESERATFAR